MRFGNIFIVGALCATFSGCFFSREVSMPEDLTGVWKTAEKNYSDRYFELRADRVIFSTGGWGVTAHPIDRMEEYREDGKVYYIIYYPNEDGEEYEFSFYYEPGQGVIRFKNQQQFEWVKWEEGMLRPPSLE